MEDRRMDLRVSRFWAGVAEALAQGGMPPARVAESVLRMGMRDVSGRWVPGSRVVSLGPPSDPDAPGWVRAMHRIKGGHA